MSLPNAKPVITIQSDWNSILRLPNGQVWISSKVLNELSTQETLTRSGNKSDGNIKINISKNYEYISLSNLSLVVKHIESELKAVFVAPTKDHNIHDKAILSVALAENSLTVSSCEADKLLVWDSRTGDQLLDLKGHGGPVYKCRFFPSGIVVLSAGADGSCRIWSAETGINPVLLKGHTMSISDISIIDRGNNIVSVSRDGSAKLWDVGKSNCLDNIVEGHGQINCCTITTTTDEVKVDNEREVGTSNKLLILGFESGLIMCAHIAKRQELFTKQIDSACNACIVVGQSIIIGCNNGKVVQLNLQDGNLISELYESASPVLSLTILANQMFAIGRQDGTCTVISLLEQHKNTRVYLTGPDCDGVRDIAFNGKWILTACRDTIIRKYDYNQINVHFK